MCKGNDKRSERYEDELNEKIANLGILTLFAEESSTIHILNLKRLYQSISCNIYIAVDWISSKEKKMD